LLLLQYWFKLNLLVKEFNIVYLQHLHIKVQHKQFNVFYIIKFFPLVFMHHNLDLQQQLN